MARAATAEPTFLVDQTGVPVSPSGPLPNGAVSVGIATLTITGLLGGTLTIPISKELASS